MASAPRLDELMRAAEAAGFAMASPDDDQLQASATVPISAILSPAVSVEDLARGSRPVVKSELPSMTASTAGSLVPKSVRTGAHSVRETVYGYLGFGVPA